MCMCVCIAHVCIRPRQLQHGRHGSAVPAHALAHVHVLDAKRAPSPLPVYVRVPHATRAGGGPDQGRPAQPVRHTLMRVPLHLGAPTAALRHSLSKAPLRKHK